MTGRHVDRRHSVGPNKAGARRKKKNKGFGIRLLLSVALSVAIAFLLVFFSSDSFVATAMFKTGARNDANIHEFYRTQDSGVVQGNIATAAGVGRITEDTAQGRLLGRRAALTDARRNLLILRQKLLREYGVPGSGTRRVSGRVAGVKVHSERIVDGLYFLQVDMPLDKFMEGVVEFE